MGSWLEEYNYYNSEETRDDSTLTWTQKTCSHNWKAIQLITTTVYDCTKCNVKKEEYDKWYSTK